MKIIGTGLSGLVGSRVVTLLQDRFSFENLSLDTGIDITDSKAVSTRIASTDAPWVFHFAAKTDVDGCEEEKNSGRDSQAWKINTGATETIVSVCQKTGKRLLYISTDFVFDGQKDAYAEEDIPDPKSWYGITKYEGEKRVLLLGARALIVRIAFPYHGMQEQKMDFVRRIARRLADGNTVESPEDQLITPTFVDDIARALERLVLTGSSGIYHAVGSNYLSPYEAAKKIASAFLFPQDRVQPVKYSDFYDGRATRPWHAALTNGKITKLDVRMKTFDEGLLEIRKQRQGSSL